MPNHVDQDLWVRGDSKELILFQEGAKQTKEYYDYDGTLKTTTELLSADCFIPYPQKYKEMDEAANKARADKPTDWMLIKDGFNSGGYEWCIENWGTKWGIYDCHLVEAKLDKKKGKLVYRFNSAWSPPLPVILAMGKRYPNLKFTLKYYEMGMGFKGVYVVEGGVEVINDYDNTYRGRRGG